MFFFFFFFFSSRRRHTRCGRDWSSDVCSSDLRRVHGVPRAAGTSPSTRAARAAWPRAARDRKSTRLNSSHVRISYAVFCLKKKKHKKKQNQETQKTTIEHQRTPENRTRSEYTD